MSARYLQGFAAATLATALACVSAAALAGGVPAVKATQSLPRPADMHNVRYCEVLPVFRDGVALTVEVYNTITLNDCPATLWSQLSAEKLATQFGATLVKLNGPRYWLMNRIEGSGDSANGKVGDFGGIQMRQVATLNMKLWQADAGERSYEERAVQRSTVWVYAKGTKVYELRNPKGEVYIMQSYAQIVDPKLGLQSLDQLGGRLKLPKGWHYSTRVLSQELALKAPGTAYIIQDDFQNTYQKLSTSL
jgi:hypothetical protein